MNTALKAWNYIYEVNSEADTKENRIALTDGVKSYTYNEMFEAWKEYASVFTALRMTNAEKARVGLLGTTSPEVILSFYALNMVGAEISMLSSLNIIKLDKIIHDIKEEHLTDLILTDEIILEKSIQYLLEKKTELGLRNIILLHTSVGGSTVPVPIYLSCEAKAEGLKRRFPMLYMDTLLFYYGKTPIGYVYGGTNYSFILHTSGTTGGSGKPVVLSDTSFNTICNNLKSIGDYDNIKKDIISPVMVDLSNVFGIAIQVHAMLSLGATIVLIPGDSINPMMYRAIKPNKISLLFGNGAMVDLWMKMNDPYGMDFSSIRMVILGGSYISSADKKKYYKFFSDHGAKDFVLLNGYGISEVGGVCTLTKPDLNDESIGYALPGYDLKFFNEDTEKYLTVKDAPCEGVLYIHSLTMATEDLDGKQIIKVDEIDGKPYVCTNDLVRIDNSGKLTYLGRANRYFLNGNGEKYQSGRVETEISRQPGIENCGIVPVYEKVGHDTLPMLCVKIAGDCLQPLETVRKALLSVFKTEHTLSAFHLPRYVLLADNLPYNANGKLDLYKINRGDVSGQKYLVDAVIMEDTVQRLTLVPLAEDKNNMILSVYKDLANGVMSDAANDFLFTPEQVRNQVQIYQILCQIYMNLMMQQSMMLLCWMNSQMTKAIHSMVTYSNVDETKKQPLN